MAPEPKNSAVWSLELRWMEGTRRRTLGKEKDKFRYPHGTLLRSDGM